MLLKVFYSDNLSDIHFHFHNRTFTLTIVRKNIRKQNIFETFQGFSSSENDLSDEDPEYQCSRSGDSSESDDTDRSLNLDL